MASTTRVEVVQAMYRRLRAGDVVGARAMWADDAVWHLTGSHDLAGDDDADGYFAVLAQWAQRYPEYAAEFRETRDVGEDVAMIFMESTGGMAPERASGLLIYRVVDETIREGWAIPTFAGGSAAF